mmetsp:Transcript_24943/g.37890  ORF Transcript_24943/g.37890 Transcript_24943/m.37890 type:complete len:206 (+) Transcript_24943:170-787(+)
MTNDTIFPNFPHSLDNEPQLGWTVEETLQWVLLKSHEATDLKHQELASMLTAKFEEGKKELRECHARTKENQENTKNDNIPSISNDKPKLSSKKITTINIKITEGPYKGKQFQLSPKSNAPCMIGRSTGKKYRDRGISLSKDGEVSTTHGKFEILNGKAYYTDTGSTNGTCLEGIKLEENNPCLLREGSVLSIGGCVLVISSLST